MPGSILTIFTPLSVNSVLFGVYDFILPIMLYCALSALVFLDLAQSEDRGAGRIVGWTAAVLLLPVIGSVAYLAFAGGTLPRARRLTVLITSLIVLGAAYGYTFVRVS